MATNLKTSYYYKSPVRKQKQEKEAEQTDKGQIMKGRKASKSPTPGTQASSHGMPQSILTYVKLMDELKGICGTIDESAVEIDHLVDLFNKREKTLKTEEGKEEAIRLREAYSIPEAL